MNTAATSFFVNQGAVKLWFWGSDTKQYSLLA